MTDARDKLYYLTSAGDYRYIIEIKDGSAVGLAAADQFYATLKTCRLLDRGIVGSFHDEIADYTRQITRICIAALARRRSCSSIFRAARKTAPNW